MAPNSIGYGWLIDGYGLTVTQPLRVLTVTGATRNSVSDGFTERRTVPEVPQPEGTLAGHLTFALKHEGVHLELLSRLFSVARRRSWKPGSAASDRAVRTPECVFL